MLLRRVAKGVTSSQLSWHKRYDFNVANFDVIANENARYKRNEVEFKFSESQEIIAGKTTLDPLRKCPYFTRHSYYANHFVFVRNIDLSLKQLFSLIQINLNYLFTHGFKETTEIF